LYVSGKAESLEHGTRVAADSIDSGRARQKLDQLAQLTNAA
jgi:anthranilate phosphoribosyltransferase